MSEMGEIGAITMQDVFERFHDLGRAGIAMPLGTMCAYKGTDSIWGLFATSEGNKPAVVVSRMERRTFNPKATTPELLGSKTLLLVQHAGEERIYSTPPTKSGLAIKPEAEVFEFDPVLRVATGLQMYFRAQTERAIIPAGFTIKEITETMPGLRQLFLGGLELTPSDRYVGNLVTAGELDAGAEETKPLRQIVRARYERQGTEASDVSIAIDPFSEQHRQNDAAVANSIQPPAVNKAVDDDPNDYFVRVTLDEKSVILRVSNTYVAELWAGSGRERREIPVNHADIITAGISGGAKVLDNGQIAPYKWWIG